MTRSNSKNYTQFKNAYKKIAKYHKHLHNDVCVWLRHNTLSPSILDAIMSQYSIILSIPDSSVQYRLKNILKFTVFWPWFPHLSRIISQRAGSQRAGIKLVSQNASLFSTQTSFERINFLSGFENILLMGDLNTTDADEKLVEFLELNLKISKTPLECPLVFRISTKWYWHPWKQLFQRLYRRNSFTETSKIFFNVTLKKI